MKIELILIGGFLGAGKTTFLKNLLSCYEGKKIGVLINEFGRIGIDGKLIAQTDEHQNDIQLVEINNGSIFCSCLKGGFIQALVKLSQTDIEYLFIENSGMSDPSNIHQILKEIACKVDRQYLYQGAVCIVDSVTFLRHVQVLAPVQNQIASSNLIVINKIDMVNQSTIKEIEEQVHKINPSAFLYETLYSKIPLEVLEENLKDNKYIGKTSNQPWNRPATYSLECDGEFGEQDILDFTNEIVKYSYRIKGLMKGEGLWWQLDVVDSSIQLIRANLSKKDVIMISKLVIIGKDTNDFGDIIIKTWEEYFKVKPTIYSDFDLCHK